MKLTDIQASGRVLGLDFIRISLAVLIFTLHLSSSHKDFTKAGEIKQFYIKRLITILPLYYFVALTSVQSAFMSLGRCGIKYPLHTLVFRSLSGRSCPSASFC